MKVERLVQILDAVQSQIRFFDTKAQLVLGIDGILAGFLGVNTETIASAISDKSPSWVSIGLDIFFAAYLIALVLSLLWGFKTVYPRTDVKQPESRIFFIHVARHYKENYKQAVEDLTGMSDEHLSDDIAKQVLANSRVGLDKYESLKKAVFWMGISVFCWVWILTLLFVAIKS